MGILTDLIAATRAEVDALDIAMGPGDPLPALQAKGLDSLVLAALRGRTQG